MKRHHNTLYVTTQGAYLAAERETAVVRVEREEKLKVPLHLLEGIVCFGSVSVSPFLMGRCCERGVGISYLTENGRFLARVQGPVSGNVLLRREQYRQADDPGRSSELARSFVTAKILNGRAVLQRSLRDHPGRAEEPRIRGAVRALAQNIEDLAQPVPLEAVRGVEGDAARTYFGVFDSLLVHQKEAFEFEGRSRRPPMDAVNALLSFLYTMLAHDASSALESVGLDPQVGFLHRDRPGRGGLALDLMEEFRPYLADRLTLSLVNRRQVRPKGFVEREGGAVWMDDDTRKAVLVAYQERKQEELRHPFLDEKTTVGMLVHLQSQLLARYLRGDIDAYPPFVWR